MKKTNPRVAKKAIATVTAINNLITANKSHFKAGTTMSEQQFLALASNIPDLNTPSFTSSFSSAADAHRYALKKVSCYTKFNKLLAHRGLVIKSKDYYSSFEIVEKARVSSEIERISARAATCAQASGILRVGQTNFNSKFTKLKASEILRVSTYFNNGF